MHPRPPYLCGLPTVYNGVMYHFTLRGKPQSTNHCYKSSCSRGYPSVYMTEKASALKADYQWQVRAQYKGALIKGRLAVVYRVFFPTKRFADWDNVHKISQDALNGIVWEDDSQIDEAHVYRRYDPMDPRIEIEVNVLE